MMIIVVLCQLCVFVGSVHLMFLPSAIINLLFLSLLSLLFLSSLSSLSLFLYISLLQGKQNLTKIHVWVQLIFSPPLLHERRCNDFHASILDVFSLFSLCPQITQHVTLLKTREMEKETEKETRKGDRLHPLRCPSFVFTSFHTKNSSPETWHPYPCLFPDFLLLSRVKDEDPIFHQEKVEPVNKDSLYYAVTHTHKDRRKEMEEEAGQIFVFNESHTHEKDFWTIKMFMKMAWLISDKRDCGLLPYSTDLLLHEVTLCFFSYMTRRVREKKVYITSSLIFSCRASFKFFLHYYYDIRGCLEFLAGSFLHHFLSSFLF